MTTDCLVEGGYNLGAGQWKPRIAELASDEDPAEMISDVLKVYRKVVDGFEELKAEITK